MRRSQSEKPWGNTLIYRFLWGIWLHTQRGDGKILLAYGLPKETILAIMMLYKNIKVKVCSLDGNTDFFEIVAGVFQEDMFTRFLDIIWLDYTIQMSIDWMKENGFTLEKAKSRQYSTQTITNVDYSDDIALLVDTPTQAKSLLYCLQQAV